MRFDDSLDTVLAAEMAGAAGIQSAWRQLVDLIGRRRGGAQAGAIERLRAIRHDVPVAVRAASARGLERANPPAALVALFADDAVAVAAPVVRSARLTADEWIALLPTMQPATRGVLRHRRDLPERVIAALSSFGPSDFALPAADLTESLIQPATPWPPAESVWPPLEEPVAAPEPAEAADVPAPILPSLRADEPAPPAFVAPDPDPFVPVATIARDLPVVAEALRLERAEPAPAPDGFARWLEQVEASSAPPSPAAETARVDDAFDSWLEQVAADPEPEIDQATQPEPKPESEAAPESQPFAELAPPALPAASSPAPAAAPVTPTPDDFAIAELVARIEAHQRTAEAKLPIPAVTPDAVVDRFRFETDAQGTIRWCDGVERGPVVGLRLTTFDGATDGVAGGAFARRAPFADARLVVPGASSAAGPWRISGTPAFDRASGRFTGYRGTARRPRPDEEPRIARATPATDALRQLVHELRTPANAISGFAEMIERELLGPVPSEYRDQAAAIRSQTADLLGAIDDIDTAARLESGRLDLRAGTVPLVPILTRAAADLSPLANARKARLDLTAADGVVAAGDAVAVERVFARLLAAVVASAGEGEVLDGALARDGDTVTLSISRPAALSAADGSLFAADEESDATGPGAPLLGAGFAFRLARKLAGQMGGTLVVAPDRLTLRLPAAVDGNVEQATV